MEGFTNEEIAVKLGCTTRTVERKLDRIRQRWAEHDPAAGGAAPAGSAG
jgi:DNA-directed RNA polymerase specialized sigma24 family protein